MARGSRDERDEGRPPLWATENRAMAAGDGVSGGSFGAPQHAAEEEPLTSAANTTQTATLAQNASVVRSPELTYGTPRCSDSVDVKLSAATVARPTPAP